MAARRLAIGLGFGLGAALLAGPVLAEDPVVHTQPLRVKAIDDIIDQIGDAIGSLGEPAKPGPAAPFNMPESKAVDTEPAPPAREAAAIPVPAAPPVVPVSPVAVPVAVPPVKHPAVVKAPAPPAVAPAPPPQRPAAPAVASSTPAVPACSVRVAATATLDQARRLPKCP